MKIPQYMKRPAIGIIALLMILSLLLPPAAIVSAQSLPSAAPELTIENFKWQDVLGSDWSVNYNSGVGEYGVGLSDFAGFKLAQPLTKPGKWLYLHLLGPKPMEGEIDVYIYWTLDSQAIQDIKTQSFNSVAQAIANCEQPGMSTFCRSLYKEGTVTSDRMTYVNSNQLSGSMAPQGSYHVRLPTALIVVGGSKVSTDYKVLLDKLSKLEAQAEQLVNSIGSTGGGQTLIKLVHYHPFAPKDPSHKGGDIVATVTQNGNPVVGQKVYLFKRATESTTALFPLDFALPRNFFQDTAPHVVLAAAGLGLDYWSSVTDKNGQITFNYIDSGSLNFDELAVDLAKNQKVQGVITAVIFDEDPLDYWASVPAGQMPPSGAQPEVVASADVTLTFNFIARITNVNTIDTREKNPGNVTVKHTDELVPGRGGNDTVLMTDIGGERNPNRPAPELWGYPLQYGDYIIMGQWDEVEVQWLDGVTLEFRAKPDWASYKLNSYAIWIGGTDSGWMDWLTTKAQSEFLNFKAAVVAFGMAVAAKGISDTGAALAARVAAERAALLAASGIAPDVAANLATVGAVPVSIAVAGKAAAATAAVCLLPFGVSLGYHYFFVPVEIRPKSVILVDFDHNATIWTLEGTATVVSAANQSNVDVTTNHSMQVAADGTFGKVTTFKQSDLSPGLVSLAKDAQNSVTLAAATPVSTQALSGQLSAAGSGGNSKMSSFLQTVMPIGAVVVLALAIGLIVRRRRKAAPVSSPSAPMVEGKPVASPIPPAPREPLAGASRFCSRCANQVRDGDVYCGKCGAPLVAATPVGTVIEAQQALFCSRCGARAQPGERFCGRCGAGLSVVSETPRAGPPAAMAAAYCTRCGTPNSAGERFCRKCGTQLIS